MVVPSQRHRQSDVWQPSKPFTMVFNNGAKVYIKGGREAGSTRGPNINWFWYDEGGRDETGLAWQLANASAIRMTSSRFSCSFRGLLFAILGILLHLRVQGHHHFLLQ